MESESSSPCSRESATCTNLRHINQALSLQPYFCMIHFNVVLLSTLVLQAVSFVQVPSPKYVHISPPQCVSNSKPRKLIFMNIWAVSVQSKAWGLRPLACWDCGFESFWLHGFCEFAFSSRSLCDGPIPLPEDFYRVYAFCVRSDAKIIL